LGLRRARHRVPHRMRRTNHCLRGHDAGPRDALAESQLVDRADGVNTSDSAQDSASETLPVYDAGADDVGAGDSGSDAEADPGETGTDASEDGAPASESGTDTSHDDADAGESGADANDPGADSGEDGAAASDGSDDGPETPCSPGEKRTCSAALTGCPGSSQGWLCAATISSSSRTALATPTSHD
jgi:hypothetical protein